MKTKMNGILTLLLAFVVQLTFAQERSISGTVSDDLGAVGDISVIVKGTPKGTLTDFDGNYTIKAKTGDVLVFSHVSYETLEKTVGASNQINAIMLAGGNTLDEVVVTALGFKREKKELVYQQQTVDSKELFASQQTSAASALSGKVAGLNISKTGGGVNPTTTILLRGVRSLTSNNEALVVIDGALSTQNAFSQLNVNDIDNVSVLKGATAAALYGSRAANGVIIVTTKKGKKGDRFKIALNSTTSFESVSMMPEFQSKYGSGWGGEYDPVENTNWGPRFDGTDRRIGPLFSDGTFQSVPYAPIKNNIRDFFDTGVTSNNSVSLSGGDEGTSFYLSLGTQNTKGIVPDDTAKRFNIRANASKKIGNVNVDINTSFYKGETDVVGSQIGAQDRPLYWFLLNTPNNIPLSSYSDWRNDFFSSPAGFYNGYYENPFWGKDSNRNTSENFRLNAGVNVTWNVNNWLTLSSRVSTNTGNALGLGWRDAQAYSTSNMIANATRPNNSLSSVTESDSQYMQFDSNIFAIGNFDLTKKLNLKTTLGYTVFTTDSNSSSITSDNLSIPGYYNINNGTPQAPRSNKSQKRTAGALGMLTFGYDDYLFVDLTGRYDKTSSLKEGNNSYFYPSAGVSLILSKLMPSLKDSNIGFAKLTASYASVNNDLTAYRVNETYSSLSNFPFGNINGFAVNNTAVADDIKKEQISTTEFGLNMGAFKNKITLDLAYYITQTDDLITAISLPSSAGASRFLTNIGSTSGNGVELSIGATPFRNKDGFTWDLSTNYTHSSSIYNGKTDDDVEAVSVGGYVGAFAVPGEEFPQMRVISYMRDGQGRVVVDPLSGNPKQGGLKNLGRILPKHVFGISNTFSFKNISLKGTLDYRTGHVYYSQLGDSMEFTGRSVESASANRQDFIWPNSVIETSPGVYVNNTNLPITGGDMTFWQNSYNDIKENYVKDASAIKLRELALTYKFTDKMLNNLPVSSLSLGVVGNNLLTWLPKENRLSDPEFSGGYFQMPPTRNIGFNLNVKF